MSKEILKSDELKEIEKSIKTLMDMLERNGWELNEEGDIIEVKTKRLVWDIMHEKDEK